MPKKLARTVKLVELVECGACQKKMLPKSLRNTLPCYCKGQPTETLPVNRQKASYGTKTEQKPRQEIEDEMRQKYEMRNEVVTYSEPIETETKQRPVIVKPPPPPRQPTATELLQQSHNEMKKVKTTRKARKD